MIRKHKIGLGRPQKQRLGLAAALAQGGARSQSAATQRVLREQFWLSRSASPTAFIHEFSARGPKQPPARFVQRKTTEYCLAKETHHMGLPRGYRTFADFERDAIRPNMRIGFSVDDLEQPESDVEFDMDPFEAALWEAEQEELEDED